MVETWQNAETQMDGEAMLKCWKYFGSFIASTEELEEMKIPKRHVIVHILERMPDFGNPKKYANWLDESLNKDLKQCCRKTTAYEHFEESLYIRMKEWLRIVNQKGR